MTDYRDDIILLLDDIYAAVLDPTSWLNVSNRLLELLDADFSHMMITDFHDENYHFNVKRKKPRRNHQQNIFHSQALNRYLQDKPAGTIVPCQDDQQIAALLIDTECSEFIAIHIPLKSHHIGWYLFGREQGKQGFSDQQQELLRLLTPHIARTYHITGNLSYSNQISNFVVETLNQVNAGIVILTAGGKVISVNQTAENYIQQGDISVVDNRLVLVNEQAAQELEDILYRPIASPADDQGFFIQYQRECGRQIYLSCIPQKAADDSRYWMPDAPKAHMVIFISDSETLIDLPWEKLKAVFSFTATEAKVARQLVNGASTEDIANNLGIATNSVRFHLKNCFSKAEVTSQVELVGLLLRTLSKLPG